MSIYCEGSRGVRERRDLQGLVDTFGTGQEGGGDLCRIRRHASDEFDDVIQSEVRERQSEKLDQAVHQERKVGNTHERLHRDLASLNEAAHSSSSSKVLLNVVLEYNSLRRSSHSCFAPDV